MLIVLKFLQEKCIARAQEVKWLNFYWHEMIPNKDIYFYKKEITEYLFFINNAKLSEVNKLVLLFFKCLEKDKELPKNYFNGL